MSDHTPSPGPWRAPTVDDLKRKGHEPHPEIVDADGHDVLNFGEVGDDQEIWYGNVLSDADRHLMIAAPALRDALEAMLHATNVAGRAESDADQEKVAQHLADAVRKGNQALALADGQEEA